jgi:hypothetical protein
VLQTNYILGKTFLPLVLAQNALRVVIQAQLMTSDNVCCGIIAGKNARN